MGSNLRFMCSTSISQDKTRHKKMVLLMERMLELASLLSPQFQQSELGGRQAPRTPGDKERVKREIEATDKAIDRLVPPMQTLYELSPARALYGLSGEEIRILKGRRSDGARFC